MTITSVLLDHNNFFLTSASPRWSILQEWHLGDFEWMTHCEPLDWSKQVVHDYSHTIFFCMTTFSSRFHPECHWQPIKQIENAFGGKISDVTLYCKWPPWSSRVSTVNYEDQEGLISLPISQYISFVEETGNFNAQLWETVVNWIMERNRAEKTALSFVLTWHWSWMLFILTCQTI